MRNCRHAPALTPHPLLNGNTVHSFILRNDPNNTHFIANKIKTTNHLRYPYWNLLSIYGREFISFANKGWAMWLQVKKEEFQVKCQ